MQQGRGKKANYSQRFKTIEQRFWEKVDKSGSCWIWTSAVGSRGYGIFWVGGDRRSKFAHRFSFEMASGYEPPSDMAVCHKCDTTLCVNPDHLFLGTFQENSLDSVAKGRTARGEKNKGGGKLTDEKARIIKSKVHKISEAASLFGVSLTTVKRIRRGSLWKHV